MPIITVEGPPIEDIEAKRRFVETLTDAMSEVYPQMDRKHFGVLIYERGCYKENLTENLASGGVLILDKHREEK